MGCIEFMEKLMLTTPIFLERRLSDEARELFKCTLDSRYPFAFKQILVRVPSGYDFKTLSSSELLVHSLLSSKFFCYLVYKHYGNWNTLQLKNIP